MAKEISLRPTKQLRELVRVYGSTGAAANAFGIHQVSLDRFLKGEHGLSGDSIAAILASTRLAFEDLFTHEEKEARA